MRKLKQMLVGAAAIAVLAAVSLPVKADALMDVSQGGVIFVFIAPPADPVLTYITPGAGNTVTSDLTTYSHAAVPTGTAAANRYTVLVVYGGATANRTVSSATMDNGGGAVAMTPVVAAAAAEGATAIFILLNTTGTTATFSVTYSGSMVRSYVDVYSITGLNSATATDTDSAIASGVAAVAGTLDVSAGGIIIAGAAKRLNGTCAWTNLTEKSDTAVESATTCSGAADSFVSAIAGRTVTATFSSTANTQSISVASFR